MSYSRSFKLKKNREILLSQEPWICHYCNKGLVNKEDITVDHRMARSGFEDRDGADEVWNLVLCCKECNKRKGNMDYKKFLHLISKSREEKKKSLKERDERVSLAREDSRVLFRKEYDMKII